MIPTLASLLAVVAALCALIFGAYIIYWDWCVYRALPSKLMKRRVLWTAILVFLVTIFLSYQGLATGLHLGLTDPRAFRGIGHLLGNVTGAVSWVVGAITIKLARKYEFTGKPRSLPERVVWLLGPIYWPWLVLLWFAIPALNAVFDNPILEWTAVVALPILGSLVFWPLIIVSLLLATKWVPDFRLRQNMRWQAYAMISIAAVLWTGYVLFYVLGTPVVVAVLVRSVFFPPVIFASYMSSKSLVAIHKLPELTIEAGGSPGPL